MYRQWRAMDEGVACEMQPDRRTTMPRDARRQVAEVKMLVTIRTACGVDPVIVAVAFPLIDIRSAAHACNVFQCVGVAVAVLLAFIWIVGFRPNDPTSARCVDKVVPGKEGREGEGRNKKEEKETGRKIKRHEGQQLWRGGLVLQ